MACDSELLRSILGSASDSLLVGSQISGKWAKLSVTYNESHQSKSHVLGKEFLNLSCSVEHKNSDAGM